jgi:catalase
MCYIIPTFLFNSQTKPEQQHNIDALAFELGKVEKVSIRDRMLGLLTQADKNLVQK